MSSKSEVIERIIPLMEKRIYYLKELVVVDTAINMLYVKLNKIWREEQDGTKE